MIQQVDDTIKVGIALGFNMDGYRYGGILIFDFASTSARGRSGVYAPQSLASKIVILSILSQLTYNWDDHAIVMGDFNEVREAAERSGSVFNERHAEIFNSFITNMNLFDVPLGGFRFTWIDKWASKMSKLDRDDLTLRISSLKILGDIERKEASELTQKAKVKWALEGDENTSFFHGSLKKKRRESAIKGILKNGVWIDDPREVKHELYTHFCNRFSCTGASHPIIEDVDFKQISVEQQEFLECDLSNEEIKRAVWNYGSDRAPGPDGFTFKFFKTFSDVIQNDVVRFVREFFQSVCFPKGCNSSFIALIPKIGGAKFMSDFRPISLISCQYKIIGKLLANRLSTVIGSCVSFEQSTFIKGINILDGPLVLNECMAWYRKRRKALMVFKVDFEKAFDSLRWDYLDVIMEKLGFGFKWRMWISGCLKNSRASMLINVSPTPEFDIFNGLRQRDPMSPFLFILAIEGLHALVSKAVSTGLVKGSSIGRGVNVLDEEVSSMALVLRCEVAKLPMMYLGVPIGSNMGRCDNWKRNLPTYYMSLYSMPITVHKRLESIRNRFFIGGDSDDKKITWVKWNSCLASKAMSGLGIGSIFALNVALLFKWIWRFCTTYNSLWVNVIKDIHGHDGGIGSGRAGKLSYSPWNSIIRTVSHLQEKGIDLLALCGGSLGDGNSISYWGDKWCGTRPLKDSFPRVYALDDNKLCTVAQRINIEDWSFVLKRPPGEVSNITEWFSWLDDAHVSKSARVILEGIASTMLWSIWNFRNASIFSSSKPKTANVWDSIVRYSFLWISPRNPKSRFRWIDWLGNPIATLTSMDDNECLELDSNLFLNKISNLEASRMIEEEFFAKGKLLEELIATLITLVPKKAKTGAPISPYLFTIVMEVFNLISQQKIKEDTSFKYNFGCKGLKITHLCFADDLLVLCHKDANSVKVIKRALKYVGVPLVVKKIGVKDCKCLIDKVKTRIHDWKNKSLNYARRAQLISYVLASIKVYWASVLKFPKAVIKDIERAFKGVLWNQSEIQKGKAKIS
uniref:Putative RNA-directed DNA polymerase, eukaryota, reverse transcriptase zinc-binding domain protein n=1 Tax=Tanacetum cinerariifolium TaxID=118510 RepID=A0A699HSA2_TANCI|nr:putative RNA-directed DNA polymerase, eukaryota, reverse transcriptase zinc-binding domain protein [Tanacetum cinerariifolium]